MNDQNPNQGGTGDSSISKLVTEAVSVSSPDNNPDYRAVGKAGSDFLGGSPAGREAKPVLREDSLDKPSLP